MVLNLLNWVGVDGLVRWGYFIGLWRMGYLEIELLVYWIITEYF